MKSDGWTEEAPSQTARLQFPRGLRAKLCDWDELSGELIQAPLSWQSHQQDT